MFRKLCKRNFGPMRNFIAHFTASQEEVEHGASSFMHKPEAKKFTELSRPANKPLLFLGYTKSAFCGTFLQPESNSQAKVLLWNSVKRQYSSQCTDVVKPVKKSLKSTKRVDFPQTWDPFNIREDYMPRYDDMYRTLLKDIPGKPAANVQKPPLQLLSASETEIKPTGLQDLQVYRPTVLKEDLSSYAYKKLNAPRPSFSERQNQLQKENAMGERKSKNYEQNKLAATPLMRLKNRGRVF